MNLTFKQIAGIVAGVVGLLLTIVFIAGSITTVGADEIVVKQGAIDGRLEVWTQPGTYMRNFGRTTTYKKSAQLWFSARKEEGKDIDESIKVRFNDGGHGNISGSLSFDLPTDAQAMVKLHSTYGSQEAIVHRLIQQVVSKSVYMAGPLMSSKESAGERRSDLINYISDQVTHGVYRTEKRETKMQDVLSGQDKTVTLVEPMRDDKAPNGIAREEKSPIDEFGIRIYNLTINGITYEAEVEAQIKQQQQAIMQVQTQMAKAKEAEQKVLTVEKEGQAKAAEAKWVQEVEKSKAVTAAEQAVAVAKLDLEAAKLTKQKEIELGQGEAERRRLVMSADGALDKKLAAYVDVNKAYAAELGKQRWVPEVQMGAGGANGSNATDLINLLQARTARDLALTVNPAAK